MRQQKIQLIPVLLLLAIQSVSVLAFQTCHGRFRSQSQLQAKYKKDFSTGYKFGDITKNIVSKVTNKPVSEYKFGDISKSIDKAAKNKVAELRFPYEFGDLSRYIDEKVKEQVNDFTNKNEYTPGDVTKEIMNRVKSRDYTVEDMIILFKILLALGANLSPVANFLPAKLLIEALDYSIAGDLGGKLINTITEELDRRMKKAFTGDENYQIGDLTKKSLLKYIGKDEYEFGDISTFVYESIQQRKENEAKASEDGSVGVEKSILEESKDRETILKELEEWDRKFLIQGNNSTKLE
ncbi:hypothetical protein CTEN210_00211 [Chaetoceros tenuissimus]|uniref:Uncharacterized protein n=1 Tax=Chaetoceros tenuissimus TaxID=426638 RepID=A0AAD3CDT9_9STRA|nr:hypothetical protein CTEN210_00211 [Chaetoceros tenuissimus]